MPLIECPECGGTRSDQSYSECQHCGYALGDTRPFLPTKEDTSRYRGYLFWGFIVFAGIMGIQLLVYLGELIFDLF